MTPVEALDALAEPCTCGSDPEGPCTYCNGVTTLRVFIEKVDRVASDWRYSHEFLGIVVREKWGMR